MGEQENVATIREIYDAFGRGDLPAIVERVTADVVWHDPGPPAVPHAGTYHGREGVAQFFMRVGETLEFEDFQPSDFLAAGDGVVVLGSLRARVLETGRSYDNDWAMAWTLRDGKVARFQVYEDTAVELEAHTAARG
jgi:ketosteroid isomerase-like protein